MSSLYYDKVLKVQVFEQKDSNGVSIPFSENVVELPADNPFFSPLEQGKRLTYDNNNIPNGVEEETDNIPEIDKLKNDRDVKLNEVTVTHNSKNWTFRPIDMQRFESKIARNRDFMWKADDGVAVILTSTQANNIAIKVDDLMTQIFFDAENEISTLG